MSSAGQLFVRVSQELPFGLVWSVWSACLGMYMKAVVSPCRIDAAHLLKQHMLLFT